MLVESKIDWGSDDLESPKCPKKPTIGPRPVRTRLFVDTRKWLPMKSAKRKLQIGAKLSLVTEVAETRPLLAS